MRWVLLAAALAACSKVNTSAPMDAAPDAKQFFDARPDGQSPPDAYAMRPCDAPASFEDLALPTRVLHVVPGAVGGDGSSATPFGSIEAAAAVATPGTFIQLAPGMHVGDQFIADLHGTYQEPIWIGGAWGTMPKISGGSEGIHLTRPAYVAIQNLEIAYQSASAITIDDGVAFAGDVQGVVIDNVYLHDVLGGTGIKASGIANQLHIQDSRIRRCAVGIDLIGVHGAVVARNTLDTVSTGGLRTRGGSTDIDVRQNRISDAGGFALTLGGFTSLYQFRPPLSTTAPNAEGRRIRAFNNVVTGETGTAFVFDNCIDCLVAHNLVAGAPRWLIRIIQNATSNGSYTFEPTKDGRVINNSFTWSIIALNAHVEATANTQPTTFTFSHNLWSCTEEPGSSNPHLPVQEDGSVIGLGTGYDPFNLGPYCGGPEGNTAAPFPEVDGTIEGWCRATGDGLTIGPQVLDIEPCNI